MQVRRWAMAATIGAMLVVMGCRQDKVTEVHHPAKLEESGSEGIMKVRLEPRAAERIGIETAPVAEATGGAARRMVVPYGAILYDTQGAAWTFTNPEPLLFVRHKVVVEKVEGNRVILSDGPPPGTTVVTVGAAELMGAEHKYGH